MLKSNHIIVQLVHKCACYSKHKKYCIILLNCNMAYIGAPGAWGILTHAYIRH